MSTCEHFNLNMMMHRPPMLLVDELLESSEEGGTTSFLIQQGNIFLDDTGKLSPAAIIEIMAQCYAATEAYQAFLAGIVKPGGYLVGLDKMKFHGEARLGDKLVSKVIKAGQVDHIYLAEGEVFKDNKLLATGKFRLYSFKS